MLRIYGRENTIYIESNILQLFLLISLYFRKINIGARPPLYFSIINIFGLKIMPAGENIKKLRLQPAIQKYVRYLYKIEH